MAQYKKGNRILSEEENTEEVLSFYGAVLFFIGVGVTIYFMRGFVPEDWSKEIRFLTIFPIAIGVGYLLSLFQAQAYIGVGYLIVIGIWTILGSIVWWLI